VGIDISSEKPLISLFGSAAHPEKWMGLYEDLTRNNDVSFEIVFVGPRTPKFALPDNFKFIISKVKPAKCFEIAARNSTGEFLVGFMSDDIILPPHTLDKLYEKYMIYNDTNVMVSTRQGQREKIELTKDELANESAESINRRQAIRDKRYKRTMLKERRRVRLEQYRKRKIVERKKIPRSNKIQLIRSIEKNWQQKLEKKVKSIVNAHIGKPSKVVIIPIPEKYYQYWLDKPDSPKMAIITLMARSKYEELGGVDSRFIALCADRDILMRFYAQGGKLVYCEDILLTEQPYSKKEKKNRLSRTFGMHYDTPMLDSLWVANKFEVSQEYMSEHKEMACNGEISSERLKEFVPFEDKDIQTISQGRMVPLCYKKGWGEMKLSVIIIGRNDGYCVNYLDRLRKSIDSLHLALKGSDYEIVIVDYNQVKDALPLSHYFNGDRIKNVVVSKDDHFRFIGRQIKNGLKLCWKDGGVYDLNDLYNDNLFWGPAFNVGFNASSGEYVLTTSPDDIFKIGLGEIVNSLSNEYMYRCKRKHITVKDLDQYDKIVHGLKYDVVKKMRKIDGKKRSIWKCAGDFILAHRDIWKDVGGYLPLAHPRSCHLDNQILFRGLACGHKIYSLDYYIVNVHVPITKSRQNIMLNLNYEASFKGATYNHFNELENEEWKKYEQWSGKSILEPNKEYYLPINYEVSKMTELFKAISPQGFYVE